MTVTRILAIIPVVWFNLLCCSVAATETLDEQGAGTGGAEARSSISSSPDDPQNQLNIIQERKAQKESLFRVSPLKPLHDATSGWEDALYEAAHLKLGLSLKAILCMTTSRVSRLMTT